MAKTDKATAKEGRSHRATYARDKKKGGYIVRVQGPQCNRFAGRSVPVEKRDGEENPEMLTELIWSGMDDGVISGYVGPVALYSFEAKPPEKMEEIPF